MALEVALAFALFHSCFGASIVGTGTTLGLTSRGNLSNDSIDRLGFGF